MPPKLPDKKSTPTHENVRRLREGLTSVIAGHAGSIDLWTFYEVVDAYVGPWGENGYPIGYGKYYCKLFNENQKLKADPQGSHWIKQTTILLQEALRDFLVTRYQQGTLSSLTEPQFRAAAFSSHPKAYTDAGLAMVVLVSPELIPVIMGIPAKEFSPTSPDLVPTVNQLLTTMGAVLPMAAGVTIAAMMPAHSGLLRHAAERDRADQSREMHLGQWLEQADKELRSGRMDNIAVLTKLTTALNAAQFPDQGFARRGREISEAADRRKREIAAYYRKLIVGDADLRPLVDKADPGWSEWL